MFNHYHHSQYLIWSNIIYDGNDYDDDDDNDDVNDDDDDDNDYVNDDDDDDYDDDDNYEFNIILFLQALIWT